MKKFLKFALKSQWKTILVILALASLQTFFQIQIIDLFHHALDNVGSKNVNLLFDNGTLMLLYTILSMVAIYAISFLSTKVSSKAAYNTREKVFHILMNLPDEEINKFKITGLISRSTRGVFTEQRFLMMVLQHFLIIPFVFIGVVVEIALIDRSFGGLFAAFVIISSIILIFKLKQVTALYFKAKKTYGKLNLLFLSKITNLVDNVRFNKQESRDEFENACKDSYEKNIAYQLSQYYVGPISILVLDVVIVFLLAMMLFGHSITLETESVVHSVVIIQYILYFITAILVMPRLIQLWPRAYATSVRLEEVLTLEDKVITYENKNNNSKRIEIIEEDFKEDGKSIFVDRRELIRKFNEVLAQHRIKVIISMVLLSISTLCIAYAPKLAENIINLIARNPSPSYSHTIFVNVIMLLIVYSVGCLFKTPSYRFMAFVGEEIVYNLRMELFEKLDSLDSRFVQQNSKGQILSRLNHDIMNIRDFITIHASEVAAQILSILFVIILILSTDWRLSLIYLITSPFYVICFYFVDIVSKQPYEDHQNHLGMMMSYFERSITNRSPDHEKDFESINKRVSDDFVRSINISNLVMPFTTFLTNLSNITVYIVGVYFLISNEIQLGTLLAVIMYGQLLSKPLKKVTSSIISLEISFSSTKRIFDIIDFKDKP